MKSRVLIAGGGVASIEATLALRDLCGDRVSVAVFAPNREFAYRPNAVGEPYGAARVTRYDLADLLARCGAEFHLASVAAVDSNARLLSTHDGEWFPYDQLILAPGVKHLWPVPGALTFWGIADQIGYRELLDRLRAEELRSLAFTLPGTESWALPLYELALLTRSELSGAGSGTRLTVVTPEDGPLCAFGRVASLGVAELLEDRRIDLITATRPVRFEDGRLAIVPGGSFDVDAVVSLPKLEGRRVRGVPCDEHGFIRIDDHCRVLGSERLFAAGDVTNFPIKQGGIATQQADVAAEAIAAELGVDLDPRRFDPVLRAELWTGEAPLYLEGWLGGGHGEASSLTVTAPWGGAEGKIVGRYLSDFIAEVERSQVPAGLSATPPGSRPDPLDSRDRRSHGDQHDE